MSERFAPRDALMTLLQRGVRFVLIGGYAASARGAEFLTGDIDICYARDAENLERLASTLRELGAKLRGRGVPDDVPFQLDARTLRLGDTFTFDTDVGKVDILGTPSGTTGFPDLDTGATDVDLGDGLVVRVASLDDLMRMKRAAGRTKDLLHLEHLAALREEIDVFRAQGLDPQQGGPI
jgi:hypothetical protein